MKAIYNHLSTGTHKQIVRRNQLDCKIKQHQKHSSNPFRVHVLLFRRADIYALSFCACAELWRSSTLVRFLFVTMVALDDNFEIFARVARFHILDRGTFKVPERQYSGKSPLLRLRQAILSAKT